MLKSPRDLNKIDRHILRVMQDDGRITYADLARQVGLTTTPCIDRVKRLEREGFIRGYSARVEPEYLDAGLIIFIQIKLDRTSKNSFDNFRTDAVNLQQVQECYLVAGNFDYLLKVRVADMAAYREFLGETLLSVPGVLESTSIVVMEAVKETLNIEVP
jgi:Lrp/AsnC family leucine-responsive transcriptional regulator